jgi:dTDP-4-dehydrorhamnose reductase
MPLTTVELIMIDNAEFKKLLVQYNGNLVSAYKFSKIEEPIDYYGETKEALFEMLKSEKDSERYVAVTALFNHHNKPEVRSILEKMRKEEPSRNVKYAIDYLLSC